MKIIRFTTTDSAPAGFGVVVRNHAVSCAALANKAGKPASNLANSQSYLANLPDSEQAEKELLAWGEQHLDELEQDEKFPLETVRLLEPIEVVALFEFGLTPTHLKNSADTLMKYENDNPANRAVVAGVRQSDHGLQAETGHRSARAVILLQE